MFFIFQNRKRNAVFQFLDKFKFRNRNQLCQFSLSYSHRFALPLERHQWLAAPISACLRPGYFGSECCTGGKAMPAPHMNCFLASRVGLKQLLTWKPLLITALANFPLLDISSNLHLEKLRC